MDFLTGGSKNTWQPVMGPDTTTSSYWLNWRLFLCCVWILTSMAMASYLITKYEGPNNRKSRIREDDDEEEDDYGGVLYDDEVWKPCLKGIHPAWLMTYRIFAFFVLLILIILNAIVDGGTIFYYYTQWTFTLITIYFGIGSLLSIYGCYQYHNKVGGDRSEEFDEEQAAIANLPNAAKSIGRKDQNHPRQVAGLWGYAFQIIFQMQAGAVVLTDCVFWLIIVPFLAMKDYNLNFFIINMHSINAVLLLGDTALNSLRFPWFRIAYFILWTCVFVVFQWVVHACIALWWPYPFLDLSSSFSPIWYLSVALLHVPCYGIFVLVIKLKHFLLSKWFPDSNRYVL
ncbi:uncharacterized protein LOC112509973 isoform X1 [Cynara cardunculus var. scolymus]|uniref:uncharacterized protein LOC112509973 isoform X1 n=2 Tax=Cynara cardunculus var. scolymus TaxID=59895 RepID=UPI000D62E8C4|nr:uncharacterized protein LOC112509973 isoform X1 [Cynara cardunculus var. scolymus]